MQGEMQCYDVITEITPREDMSSLARQTGRESIGIAEHGFLIILAVEADTKTRYFRGWLRAKFRPGSEVSSVLKQGPARFAC